MTDDQLNTLQRESFGYFLHEANPANGLVADKNEPDWPSSIAATGLALACYPVGVERGFMPRAAAVERTLRTLRFFWSSPHGGVALLPNVPITLKALKPKDSDIDPQSLGEHIKHCRLLRKLNQKEASTLLGVRSWTVLNEGGKGTDKPLNLHG